MTVAYGVTSAAPSGTSAGTGVTSVTPTAPATMNTGDMVIIVVLNKDDSATPSTPTDWTLGATVAGGFGASGNGTGATRCTIFYREKDAGWSTMPFITVTSGTAVVGMSFTLTKDASKSWDLAFATGAKSDANSTSYSATATTDPGLTAGDVTVTAIGIGDDVPTFSAENITATGVSAWGTMTERAEGNTSRGGDCKVVIFDRAVTTGTSSAAPAVSATISAAMSGPFVTVRAREVATSTPVSGSETNSLSVSESVSVVNQVSASDTMSLSVSESVATDVSLSRTDSASLSVNEGGLPTVSLLTSNFDTTAQTAPYTTASISPTAGKFVYAFITNTVGTGSTPQPTLSGNNLTWSLVTNATIGSRSIWLYAAEAISPTSGAVTITHDGTTTITACHWHIIEISNVDDSTFSNGIVQTIAPTNTGTASNISYDVEILDDYHIALVGGYSPVQETFTITSDSGTATPHELAETTDSTPATSTVSGYFLVGPTEVVATVFITGDSASSVTRRAIGAEIATVAGTAGQVEEVTPSTPISGSETNSLSVSESASTAVTQPVSDSASLSVSETSTIQKNISASDSISLSASDTSSSAVSSSHSDTMSLSVSESTQQAAVLTGSDSASLSVTETAGNATSSGASDTASLSVSETTSGSVTAQASETNSLSVTETIAVHKEIVASETVSLSVTESASAGIFAEKTASDSASLSLTEQTASDRGITASDTAALSVSETTSSERTIVASETNSLSVTETATPQAVFPGSDSATLMVSESVDIQTSGEIAKSGSDSIQLSVSDIASGASVTISRNDTISLSVTDSGTTGGENTISGTDSVSLSVSETTAVHKTISASDTGSLSVSESQSMANSETSSDAATLSVSESTALHVSRSTSDTLTIGSSETSETFVTISSSDTMSLSVSEQAQQTTGIVATDDMSLSVTETSGIEEPAFGTLMAYHQGQFKTGVLKYYTGGVWTEPIVRRYTGGGWV